MRELDGAVHHKVGIVSSLYMLSKNLLELVHQFLQVFCRQICVGTNATNVLHGGDSVFEKVAFKAHNHAREHLDKATITVPGKARIFSLRNKTIDGVVI